MELFPSVFLLLFLLQRHRWNSLKIFVTLTINMFYLHVYIYINKAVILNKMLMAKDFFPRKNVQK